jgi:hypothetical protein
MDRHQRSRRTCVWEHGLQSWRANSAGVAKRPRVSDLPPETPNATTRTFPIAAVAPPLESLLTTPPLQVNPYVFFADTLAAWAHQPARLQALTANLDDKQKMTMSGIMAAAEEMKKAAAAVPAGVHGLLAQR